MKNPITDASVGDILFGTNNKNQYGIPAHYIIYLGAGNLDGHFDGAMITSSSKKEFGNIQLMQNHIQIRDQQGRLFRFKYRNDTHVSPQRYHKRIDWEPFDKVGELTKEGLQFVLDHLSDNAEVFKHNL